MEDIDWSTLTQGRDYENGIRYISVKPYGIVTPKSNFFIFSMLERELEIRGLLIDPDIFVFELDLQELDIEEVKRFFGREMPLMGGIIIKAIEHEHKIDKRDFPEYAYELNLKEEQILINFIGYNFFKRFKIRKEDNYYYATDDSYYIMDGRYIKCYNKFDGFNHLKNYILYRYYKYRDLSLVNLNNVSHQILDVFEKGDNPYVKIKLNNLRPGRFLREIIMVNPNKTKFVVRRLENTTKIITIDAIIGFET